MHTRLLTLFAALLFGVIAVAAQQTNKFENEIRAFEQADQQKPPQPGSILFTGSSSIRMWKALDEDLPKWRVLNRGFGGSQIDEVNFYFDRIIPQHKPSTIVMYCGGNDINTGKSAERVFEDYKKFVGKVRAALPETHVAYISIAPNPARWNQMDRVREANRLIKDFAQREKNLSFIDVYPHMLGPDGMPKPDIFVDDKLHMNANGYAIWKEVVAAHLTGLPSAKASLRKP